MSILIGTPLDDTLAGDVSDTNTIFGDAVDALPAGNTGGSDVLNGGANSSNTIFGDVGQNLTAATGVTTKSLVVLPASTLSSAMPQA